MQIHPSLEGLLRKQREEGFERARRLREAASTQSNLKSAAQAFLDFWTKDGSTCFRQEEEVLFPVLARYGEEVSQEPLNRISEQHARLRALIMELSDEVIQDSLHPETLSKLGELYESHIQLKEDRVYPAIEAGLPAGALEELSSRLRTFDAGAHAEPWVPAESISYDPWPGPGDSEGGGWDR